jgi:hypothetical protein
MHASGLVSNPEAFHVWAKEIIDGGLWGGIMKPLSQGDGVTLAAAISWGEPSRRLSFIAGKLSSITYAENNS